MIRTVTCIQPVDTRTTLGCAASKLHISRAACLAVATFSMMAPS